jgi:hypothetical protein
VALLVMACTDEAGSGWTQRGLRLAAMTPALAGLAAGALARQREARGEERALALCGARAGRRALGFGLGGALLGPAVLLGVLAAPDLGALLPVLERSSWGPSVAGFEAPALGARVEEPGGAVRFEAPREEGRRARPDRRVLGLALAVACWVGPWWAALPCGGRGRALGAAGAVLGAITALHAIAMGASAWWLWVPWAALLAHGWGLRDGPAP